MQGLGTRGQIKVSFYSTGRFKKKSICEFTKCTMYTNVEKRGHLFTGHFWVLSLEQVGPMEADGRKITC